MQVEEEQRPVVIFKVTRALLSKACAAEGMAALASNMALYKILCCLINIVVTSSILCGRTHTGCAFSVKNSWRTWRQGNPVPFLCCLHNQWLLGQIACFRPVWNLVDAGICSSAVQASGRSRKLPAQ